MRNILKRPLPLLATGILCIAMLSLAGCGKKGAPHAPGPASAITYPHLYPPE